MKKVVLFFAVAIAAVSANAQTDKGQWLVGGNASFNTSKSDFGFVEDEEIADAKTTNLSLNPNAGYFFMNNLAGGLRVNLSSTSTKGEHEQGDVKATSSIYTIAPFVRYYFVSLNDNKVKLFGDASYGFGSTKSKIEVDGDEVADGSASVSSFGIAAGPAFFLSPNTALEVTLNYNSTKFEDSDANGSFGIGVGFQIHLGGKK